MIAIDLGIDVEKTRKILTDFIGEEMGKAGFGKAVVGVSGGVDSALSCFLAADALGPENVLAIRMPYETSSPESLAHAELVIEATGVQSKTISITEIVAPLFARFPEADRVRRGNAMARARMMALFDQSAAFGGLVMGTGNKTEILLGYTTVYGDSACSINPLGDLYKAQVRQLAREMGVPEVIIAKPPSADLWEGQTDEGELGFTYDEVDKLLYFMVEQKKSPEESVTAGFGEDFVKAVVERMARNQFKRMMPPVAKVR